ncbi:MAG TPA: helix-turn-helix domain-containing protein, partial [Pyrinomonadaceae bacterium]|nr:helix-turn-helix domain-containing protein [Pyrinomonadaceae bacterium]
QQLNAYDWPGNVRELRNSLERAAALTSDDELTAEQLLTPMTQTRATTDAHASANAPPTLEALERQHILRVLAEAGHNRERAAAILGISARTLYRKLREYETGSKPTTLTTED